TLHPVSSAPAVGFGVLLLPLMDTLRVFSVRILRGRSPFTPDRNHIHHLLLGRGFNHKSVSLICVLSTVSVSIAAFTFQSIGTTPMIAMLMTAFCSLIYVINYKRSKYNLRVIKGEINSEIKEGNVKLMPLFDAKSAVVEEE
ncbi:MAG TPA: undecaprenyl/decaprenyl-phosphate alpha-N-acetylglucosaminyl 1-phosphate transferase, partial [Segetibacter sp.]